MHYSYQNWASVNPQADPVSPPVADDLQTLEDSLSMDWDAVIEASQEKRTSTAPALSADVLQTQLEKLWQIADSHYQDNKALAAQVQALLDERAQLLARLHGYEMEVSRYRQLFGNLYLRH